MSSGEETISVLLPVHAGVAPAHFSAALESVLTQTRQPDEIVVVEDGPLLRGHLVVLAEVEARHPRVTRISLPENRGAGVANQAGLEAATGTWIAKVDADDISVPDRFERQLAEVTGAGYDVCGGAMLEFDADITAPSGRRPRPATQTGIARLMRFNNPINHPTSFYRRALALEAGGYPPMRYMQDYVLFARMLSAGATMTNLEDDLVYFRAGTGVITRRRAPEFLRLEWQLQRELHALGIIGNLRRGRNLVVRLAYRRMPGFVTRRVHERALRSASGPPGSAPTGTPDR